MYGHGCCQAEVSLGDSFGWPYILGTHTAGKPVKHVNEPYSVLDCGCLFTTTFSEKKNKLHHLAGVPPDFCQPIVYILYIVNQIVLNPFLDILAATPQFLEAFTPYVILKAKKDCQQKAVICSVSQSLFN